MRTSRFALIAAGGAAAAAGGLQLQVPLYGRRSYPGCRHRTGRDARRRLRWSTDA